MAIPIHRLRRAISLTSSLLSHRLRPLSSISNHSLIRNPNSTSPFARALSFRSSPELSNRRNFDDGKEIGPDEILFEGCDYKHWLITIDFPKDPKPTDEEMVEFYVQTAAKIFGSVEEAKKRIYACSTTTYNGFQAVMDEETSEKFRGLPGVVFILPDSYIDPVNKEYGGDKYENGVITPRPPPVQYSRQGRYGDRNRNYDRNTNYDRTRYRDSPPQGNQSQGGGGYSEGGRDFGAGRRDGYQGGNFGPGNYSPQQGMNSPQGQGGNFAPQQGMNSPQGQAGNFPRGPGGNFPPQDNRNFGQGQGGSFPPQERNFAQSQGGNFPPREQGNFSQGQGGNFSPREQANFSQGQGGGYGSGPAGYRQGPAQGYGGDHGQPSATGYGSAYNANNRQGMGPTGDARQRPGFGQEQNSTGPVEGQWQAKY